MARASWNGAVLAQADTYEFVEGNVYFPPEALDHRYLVPSRTSTTCPWKGTASYYDVVVDGRTNHDAAWYYPAPSPEAAKIKDHVAFWRGVEVER